MLRAEQRDAIFQFDTCKLANAIERLNLRLRNEGFTRPGLHCMTGRFAAVLGYAVTSRVRCDDPPMKGYSYYDLADWWALLRAQPGPHVAVIEDLDAHPGQGAVLSDVHAVILRSLGCEGVVTNGAVRNVPALAQLGFAAFAGQIAMSHEYVHMVACETEVEVFGLRIAPADLIYADVHGALLLPEDRVDDILRAAHDQVAKERRIFDLCRSPEHSFDKLREEVKRL
jgi:4-hydroxy-4-methyl-2-oxoglutarate aldolase